MGKKILSIGLILLFIGTILVPNISSYTNTDPTPEPQLQESFCNIIRPIRALYLNDMEIWQFKLIQRGVILGDITIEVDAVDETWGIEYVEIKIDGTRMEAINEAPYEYLWNTWRPGFHIIDARAFINNGTFIDAESFQIVKFG